MKSKPKVRNVMLAHRVPVALKERLAAYAEKVGRETGYPVSRTDVLVRLLTEALDGKGRR